MGRLSFLKSVIAYTHILYLESFRVVFVRAFVYYITHMSTHVLCSVYRFMDQLGKQLESHIEQLGVEGGYILVDSDQDEVEEVDEGEQSDNSVDDEVVTEPSAPVAQEEPIAARCPWARHCDGCETLHNSTFLKNGEFELHGCCGGTSGPGEAVCKAYPEPPAEDLLRQVSTHVCVDGGWDSSAWRVRSCTGWLPVVHTVSGHVEWVGEQTRASYACSYTGTSTMLEGLNLAELMRSLACIVGPAGFHRGTGPHHQLPEEKLGLC